LFIAVPHGRRRDYPCSMYSRMPPGPVVVTGGSGFLGREIVRQILAAGATDVRTLDIELSTGIPGVRHFQCDIRDSDLRKALAGARTVIHCAACQYHTPLAKNTYRLPFFEVNVRGTIRLLEAARREVVERFVFVSTNMVYGLPRALPITEMHPRLPFGPYGRSKLEAEGVVEAARKDMIASIIRPGLIVGPGRRGVIARVFDAVLTGSPVFLIGSGRNRYEMMSVEDVASLAIAATEKSVTVNCAARSVPTMREWIEAVARRVKSRSRIVGTPGSLAKVALATLEGVHAAPLRRDQYLIADRDYYLDGTRARSAVGWTPKWTGIDAVLSNFEWYVAARDAS
jgi:nucleoside-diphosphate-sugar epimerase